MKSVRLVLDRIVPGNQAVMLEAGNPFQEYGRVQGAAGQHRLLGRHREPIVEGQLCVLASVSHTGPWTVEAPSEELLTPWN